MDKGSYHGRRVDFAKYAASVFIPYLFCRPFLTTVGCGACALALFTGVDPEEITNMNGGDHYTDAFMVRFLRRRGFAVLNLTLCNLSATSTRIRKNHVVLLSQLFRKNEGTWGIINNDYYYHNFDCYILESISLLNKPVLSAYLVFHPSWGSGRLATEKLSPEANAKGAGLTLASLGLVSSKLRRSVGIKA